MKKYITILIIIGISFSLISCMSDLNPDETIEPTVVPTLPISPVDPTDPIDYTNLLTEFSNDIKDQIPQMINQSFSLPTFNDVIVSYVLDDLSFTDTFIYTSPFFDEEKTMMFSLRKGNTVVTGSKEFLLVAQDSGRNESKIYLNIPGHIDQVTTTEYVPTSVIVKTNINGEEVIEHETFAAQLRSRGNSTQMFPKKPYRLRFDEKTSILGMPEAKNYVLLAEYSDKSLIRNVITHKMSTLIDGIDYSLQTRFVELYVNDEYRGVYVLTEQVEIYDSKLSFESIPGIYNTGFFIELDHRYDSNIDQLGFDWVMVRGLPYSIKEPDSGDPLFTTAHHDYIFEYIIATENALSAKTGYQSLIDINNWVAYFMIQELVKNVDVGWSSVYMHKAPDEKLMFGPLWDFDLAFGNAEYIDYGVENFYGMRDHKNKMFRLMMAIPEVRTLFRDKVQDFYTNTLPTMLELILVLEDGVEEMAGRNFDRWPILGEYVWPNPYEMWVRASYRNQIVYVYNYLDNRAEWLNNAVTTSDYNAGNFN
jgi:hypothetical protein